MRSFFLVALAALAAEALHVPSLQHRARHPDIGRALAEGERIVARAPGLRRLGRCPKPNGLTSSSTQPPPATNVGPKPTPPPNPGNGGTPTQPGAQPGAVASLTRGNAADPWLTSLSRPLNYAAEPQFTRTYTGDLTFYAQSLTACGDTYDDRTLTAAVSHEMYDSWAGDCSATNRCGICGPYVNGRRFITPADVKVPGNPFIVIGGDSLPNCSPGVQCHKPLTATVTNPATGLSVRVHIVDRCAACAHGDCDLSPAAFLRITRPGLNLANLTTPQLMTEALKDPGGRIPGTWRFDRVQNFGPVQRV